jgi:1-deoxy-D-xylulose-5-phosphate synthase
MLPVVALYSTFLQRSYDMILQDICMLHLHVILAVDRAGLVGEDGETHHGLFDIGFLRQAPGLKILCPGSCAELSQMLRWAACEYDGPVAIRYPRGGDRDYSESAWSAACGEKGGICVHRQGSDVVIITYGTMVQNAMDAAEILHQQGVEATVLRLLTLQPLPVNAILSASSENKHFVVLEEVCSGCGIKETLAWELQHQLKECRIDGVDLGNQYITHGSVSQLYKHYGLDGQSVAQFIMEVRSGEN